VSIIDVRYFKAADCDTDHYLLVAKDREKKSGSKRGAFKFDKEGFNLRKPNEVEIQER
jgi:hypothetical protein